MSAGPDDLELLLGDIRRTILDNQRFLQGLKEEGRENGDQEENSEEGEGNGEEGEEFEEL